MGSTERVRKTGFCLYDGQIRCPVRIVETRSRPFFLDCEEAGAPMADEPTTWFRIDLTPAGEPDWWASSIEGFRSLDEALAYFGSSMTWNPCAL